MSVSHATIISFNATIISFSLLSAASAATLIFLTSNRKIRFANVFNLCIHNMAKCLLIYGLTTICLLANEDVLSTDGSKGTRPLHYFISFLLLIRGCASIIAAALNAIISKSIYNLIVNSSFHDYKDLVQRIKFFTLIFFSIIPFFIVTIIQEFSNTKRSRTMQKQATNNLIAISFKLVFAFYSLFISIYCEYNVFKKFPMQTGKGGDGRYRIIRTFINKMLFFSVIQFISLFPIFLAGSEEGFHFTYSSRSKEDLFYILGQIFLLMNPVFLLITYFQIDPESWLRTKNILCCVATFSDDDMEIKDVSNDTQVHSNIASSNSSSKTNSKDEYQFSEYKSDKFSENSRISSEARDTQYSFSSDQNNSFSNVSNQKMNMILSHLQNPNIPTTSKEDKSGPFDGQSPFHHSRNSSSGDDKTLKSSVNSTNKRINLLNERELLSEMNESTI